LNYSDSATSDWTKSIQICNSLIFQLVWHIYFQTDVLWYKEWSDAHEPRCERIWESSGGGLRSAPAVVVHQFIGASCQCRHHHRHQCFHEWIQVYLLYIHLS